MSKKKANEEPRAGDLLPPDGPSKVDPRTADDTLEPEVETRKVGIRRVHALGFGNRMWSRANRRSVGNSRRFWRNIEADDPFLKAPARPTDMPLEIYPAQRIDRTSGSLPKPQPDVARQYPPVRQESPSSKPPKPRREAPRKETRRPEPTHTPEPRPAPTPPKPRASEPEPVAEPVAPPAPAQPPAGRRLPPKPPSSGRTRSGRQRMPSAASKSGAPRKSAAEIRAEKQRKRDIVAEKDKPKKAKASYNLDQYRDFVQMMEIQQAAYERGEEIPRAFADKGDDARRPAPKPKAEAKPAPKPAPPAPKPTPTVDRTPPKPKKETRPAPPINRSPSGGSGGLDDLFGGGAQEGRVRIGRRSKPKPDEEEES